MKELKNTVNSSELKIEKNLEYQINHIYNFTVLDTEELRDGPDNILYTVLSDQGEYVFRVSKRLLHENDLRYEHFLVSKLSQNSFPTAKWISTKNDSPFTKNNNSYGTLFERVKGYAPQVDKTTKPSLDVVHEAGLALGRLHSLTQDMKIPFPRTRTIYTEINRVIEQAELFEKVFEDGSGFVSLVKNTVQELQNRPEICGVLHHDFRPQNMLFQESKLNAVIDFDWACNGPLIKDLGLALAEWSFPDGAEGSWEDVFETMLVAYNQTSPKKIEKDSNLYKWIAFSCLSDASTYFADVASETNDYTAKEQLRSYMYKKYKYFKSLI